MDIRGAQAVNQNSQLAKDSIIEWKRVLHTFIAQPVRNPPAPILSGSLASKPISTDQQHFRGYGRGAGEAIPSVQRAVMSLIIEKTESWPIEDRLIFLSTAKIESGFNPDAASTSSSASGVFQLTAATASAYGLDGTSVFDASLNINAAMKLFSFNKRLTSERYPRLQGEDRAMMLYWLHHDGPSLAYGGNTISQVRFLPELRKARALFGG